MADEQSKDTSKDSSKDNQTQENTFGQKIIEAAKKYLGIPYVLGGDGVTSTDCGMFTLKTFQDCGVDLKSRCADDQCQNLLADGGTCFEDMESAIAGDLIFFHHTYACDAWQDITHVGIYIQDGQGIAANCSTGVAVFDISSDYWQKFNPIFGRRPENPIKVGDKTKKLDVSKLNLKKVAGAEKASYDGCKIIPAGGRRVTITKLPDGKTFCEPVYPDLITVSDIIPKWVLDNTISNINQSAEYKQLIDDYDKFTKEFETFKEGQFEAWCKANNKDFSTETAKKAAASDYDLAQKSSSNLFDHGIYIGENAEDLKVKIKDYIQKDKDFQDKIAAAKSKQDSDSSNGQAEAKTTTAKDTTSNADMAANAKAAAGTNEVQTDN